MPNFLMKFGSYSLPRSFRPTGAEHSFADGGVARLRTSGSITKRPRLTETTLPVVGEYTAENLTAFLAIRDEIVSSCAGQGDLFYGRDDRFHGNVTLERVSTLYPEDGILYGVYGTVSLSFVARDLPEAFGMVAHVPILTSAGGSFVAQGDAETQALPTWTITIGASGAGPLTLTNTTTGDTCIIALPNAASFAAGDVIVLDRETYTATRNGIAVLGMFDRRIPAIAGAVSNAITLTDGTATVSSLSVGYLPRFR